MDCARSDARLADAEAPRGRVARVAPRENEGAREAEADGGFGLVHHHRWKVRPNLGAATVRAFAPGDLKDRTAVARDPRGASGVAAPRLGGASRGA